MDLLELARMRGLNPKRVSSVGEGEFHSPCPFCGGRDRFSIHLGRNRYFCRQCRKTGDAIQFLREVEGRSFSDAASIVGHYSLPPPERKAQTDLNFSKWRERASHFSESSHRVLLRNNLAIESILKRGIILDSIKKFNLGWNAKDAWEPPQEWGFGADAKKVFLPSGIVIPFSESGRVIKLKIRRSGWYEGDKFPKYLEVRGSRQKSILLNQIISNPTMILESELDGILMEQVGGDLCNFLPLGGATKRPDAETSRFLNQNPLLFFSLDFDEAGKSAFSWWSSSFARLVIWVPPKGKSPGDAYHQGIDLRFWLQLGLEKVINAS